MLVMVAFGIAPLVLRFYEFPAMHVRWDSNAYGSIVWTLLGLHLTHLITDLGDTIVLASSCSPSMVQTNAVSETCRTMRSTGTL